MEPAASAASQPVASRGMPECLSQYEILRRQALEPESEDTSNAAGLERAFIQRRGLVAWLERGPGCPPARVGSAEGQTLEPQETPTPHRDLVLTLASLVVVDRQEEHDGRPR